MKHVSTTVVSVIVDPGFGERLASLSQEVPVWIVGSDMNTPVVKRLWAECSSANLPAGITLFMSGSELSPEEHFLSTIDNVDLHHGEHSCDPPYSDIEVTGCVASESIRGALAEIGFTITSSTSVGFHASKYVD